LHIIHYVVLSCNNKLYEFYAHPYIIFSWLLNSYLDQFWNYEYPTYMYSNKLNCFTNTFGKCLVYILYTVIYLQCHIRIILLSHNWSYEPYSFIRTCTTIIDILCVNYIMMFIIINVKSFMIPFCPLMFYYYILLCKIISYQLVVKVVTFMQSEVYLQV